ncbi:MAG: hypothetical protein EOM50_09890 [Erysipelotrichia bacterium]|nr:hypothetical protein [Erysipelotrichia bacterium]
MTKVSTLGLVSIVACICLQGCVPPPNGGRVTGTELRDLFFKQESREERLQKIETEKIQRENDFRAFLQKRIDENPVRASRKWYNESYFSHYFRKNLIVVFDAVEEGEIPNTVIKNAAGKPEDIFGEPLFIMDKYKDDFGQKIEKELKICPATYLLQSSNNGAQFLLEYATQAFQKSPVETGPSYLVAATNNEMVNLLIQRGDIASSVVLDIDEHEARGKSFKKQVGAQQIGLMLRQYFAGDGVRTTSVNRKRLVTALLIKNNALSFSQNCRLDLWMSSIKFVLRDTNPVTIKFLNALASQNQQKATNVLLSDPFIRELFSQNQPTE